jgi:hypothetical protein
MYVDRSTGRLGGLNNSESGGVVDAKNLRVKVNLWVLDWLLFLFFLCAIWLDSLKMHAGKVASIEVGLG